MKKIFALGVLLTFFSLLFTAKAYGISPTGKKAQASVSASEEQQINDLKDRIAQRVAQLKLVERRGIMGVATDITDTQITLNDLQDNIRFVDVDELTKFSSPSAKESFGISDISKGAKLEVLGLYNKQSRRLLARFVTVTVLSKVIHGYVVSTDLDNYTVTVKTPKDEKVFVDVQTTTKTRSFGKDAGLVRSGFSKIKEGGRVVIIGFPDTKDKNTLVAWRILLLTDFPKVLVTESPPPIPTTAEPTGNGKKVTPKQ